MTVRMDLQIPLVDVSATMNYPDPFRGTPKGSTKNIRVGEPGILTHNPSDE